VAGLQFGRGKTEKLFSGERIFRFTSANLFLDFVRAEEGSGEESARASEFFFGNGGICHLLQTTQKTTTMTLLSNNLSAQLL